MLTQRAFDIGRDRDFVLELVCLRAFEEMPSWARPASFRQFREGWLRTSQPQAVIEDIEESQHDPRTLAEVWEEDGRSAGFLWLTFSKDEGLTATFAGIRLLAVATEHQRKGIGGLMLLRAEAESRKNGAVSLRSETTSDNEAATAMHGKQGFKVISYQYEKLLTAS